MKCVLSEGQNQLCYSIVMRFSDLAAYGLTYALKGVSIAPFWLLHRFSDVAFVLVFYVLRYRRRVVLENLQRSFPNKTIDEIKKIERQFYRHLCDLIFETIKVASLTHEELRDRCRLQTPDEYARVRASGRPVIGISSHLGNWEWLVLDLALQGGLHILGVYKPLTSRVLDSWIKKTRERFGTEMIAMKVVPTAIRYDYGKPWLLGLLADQAPHHYDRAFQVRFLNQDTYVVPGPGVITARENALPIWGWMKCVGRSRYEWGVEILDEDQLPVAGASDFDREQVARIAKAYSITLDQSLFAYRLTLAYCTRLEAAINASPSDWLWSHRRWKSR